MEELIRFACALVGLVMVVGIFYWAMQVLMVPGAPMSPGVRLVFRSVRNLMRLAGQTMRVDQRRRQLWALYVPISLLAVIATTLAITLLGYTLIFYGISNDSLHVSYVNSVSSLSVLGFGGEPSTLLQTTLALAEAFTGPIIVALLIAYLATMNSSFTQQQRRLEKMDDALGGVDSGPELLIQKAENNGLADLPAIWKAWGDEFSTFAAHSDSVQAYLLLFAPSMHTHWVTDALTVLDSANFWNNVVDQPADADAAACLVNGSEAITQAVNTFHHHVITFRHDLSVMEVTPDQFQHACGDLTAAGVKLKPDRDAAWTAFRTQRATYGQAVHKLAEMMDAPIELW